MRKVIFLIVVIQCCFFYGQQGQGGEKPKPPKFISSDRVGILYYETEDASIAIKVKEDSDRFYDMSKAIRNYNGKVKEIAFLNSKNFKELDLVINGMLNSEEPVETDPAVQKKKQEETEHLRGIIPGVRKKVLGFEKELNQKLETVLKEKQYKKWLKYQKKQKRTLLPERPKTNNSNNNAQGSNFGNRGGIQGQRGLRGY